MKHTKHFDSKPIQELENKIAFKEKDIDNQYYRNDKGDWIKCDESKIMSLWRKWVTSKNVYRYRDDDGFLVYDYKTT